MLGTAFAAAAEDVSPSVVHIGVARSGRTRALRWSSASGVIVRADGLVLTNEHVVKDGIAFRVSLSDGRRLPARLVGSDGATDLALLAVDADHLHAAELGRAEDVRVGDWAIAIGSPYGLAHSVSAGVVSAVGRWGLGEQTIEDFVQTDAVIRPGSSGGPLVDLEGRVIGINTMTIGDGSIGLAISCDVARRVVEQLAEHGEVRWPWLGVAVKRRFHASVDGPRLVVTGVAPGSPTDGALVTGDVILRVDGGVADDERGFVRHVLLAPVGARFAIELERGSERARVGLTSEQRPTPLTQDRAGAIHGPPWC